MPRPFYRKILIASAAFVAIWLGIRYLLPILFPFLLGMLLALGAEPLVNFGQKRLRLPRVAATGIGITMALVLVFAVILLLAALVVRELGALSGILPNLEETARQGLILLEDWLLGLADRAPDGIRPVLLQGVTNLFSGGSAFLERITNWLLGFASGLLSMIPDGVLGLGTTVLSAYMISAKLPDLKEYLHRHLSDRWKTHYLPALAGLKTALWGWLRAQAKLALITFLISAAGLLLLRVSYAPLWALVVALVDAVPLLGTGTVLVPWSLVCLLQGSQLQAIGLLAIYAVSTLTRSALEPRLVGKQLGLDPLVTLLALYAGYRLLGIGGMIISPMLAMAVTQLIRMREETV